MNKLTPAALKQAALQAEKRYSNYSGYLGDDDEFLNFSGDSGSFAQPVRQSRTFTCSLNNATANNDSVLLCPGLVPSEPGTITDGVFVGVGGNNITGTTGSPGRIKDFVWFIQKMPSLIAGIKLVSTNAVQMAQTLTIVEKSPFKQAESKVIDTGIFQSAYAFNGTILEVAEPFYMDYKTQVQYPVMANTTVVITFFVGVSLDTAKALREKHSEAKATAATMQVTPNQPTLLGK